MSRSKANRRSTLLVSLALILLTAGVYSRVRQAEFLAYDDDEYVVDNPWVRAGLTWRGTVWAFASAHSATWHPLTSLSHMLDCQLFGVQPGPHHVVSVVLHGATSVLLFLTLLRMTGSTGRSAVVAALFAIHPLHVESVAWVSERKDVLSGVFWVATLLGYWRWVQKPTTGRYLVALSAFAAGLLAKPSVVTLPIVLLLLDHWPLRRAARGSGAWSARRFRIFSWLAARASSPW